MEKTHKIQYFVMQQYKIQNATLSDTVGNYVERCRIMHALGLGLRHFVITNYYIFFLKLLIARIMVTFWRLFI